MVRALLHTVLLLTITAPVVAEEEPSCGCEDPLDVLILVDRSASISRTDYISARQFVHDFTRRLSVSPSQANVAIAQFDTGVDLFLDFVDGWSFGNVDAAINTMSCDCGTTSLDFSLRPWEVPPSREVCCARRSSISNAITRASQILATNGREGSCRAVLLITDGRHNTLADQATPCNGAACAADLREAIETLATENPGVALWGAGTGDTDHWSLALIDGGRFGRLTSDLEGVLDCPAPE